MRLRHPPLVAVVVCALIAACIAGCPGTLEDPDRFDEPDAKTDAATSDAGIDS